MSTKNSIPPVGDTHKAGRGRRAQHPAYQEALEEIAPFEQLARMVLRLRMERDLTQQALAGLLGTSVPTISRLESGQHRPNVETLQKLARAFDRQLVVGFVDPAYGASQQPLLARIADRDAEIVTLA